MEIRAVIEMLSVTKAEFVTQQFELSQVIRQYNAIANTAEAKKFQAKYMAAAASIAGITEAIELLHQLEGLQK